MRRNQEFISRLSKYLFLHHYNIGDRIDPWVHGEEYDKAIKTHRPHSHNNDCVHIFKAEKSGTNYAVKVLDKNRSDNTHLDCMRNSKKWMSRLDHPNIIKFIDCFENDDFMVNVMPYYEKDLMSIGGSISQDDLNIIINNILSAIQYLEDNGCCHADITESNILISKDGHGVLCDFQAAFELEEKGFDINGKKNIQQCCGTCNNVNFKDLISRMGALWPRLKIHFMVEGMGLISLIETLKDLEMSLTGII